MMCDGEMASSGDETRWGKWDCDPVLHASRRSSDSVRRSSISILNLTAGKWNRNCGNKPQIGDYWTRKTGKGIESSNNKTARTTAKTNQASSTKSLVSPPLNFSIPFSPSQDISTGHWMTSLSTGTTKEFLLLSLCCVVGEEKFASSLRGSSSWSKNQIDVRRLKTGERKTAYLCTRGGTVIKLRP